MAGRLSVIGRTPALVLAGLLAGVPALTAQEQSAPPQGEQEQQPQLLSLPSRQAQEERAAVVELLQMQAPKDRLTLVEEFLRKYPESPLRARVYLGAAEAYRMLQNYEKAIEFGEKVLKLSPNDLIARILIAESLVESTLPSETGSGQRYQRAEDLARKVLELIPELYKDESRPAGLTPEEFDLQRTYIASQPRAALGFLYLRKEEYQKAEEELKQSVELNRLSPNGTDYLRLGFAHIRQEEWAEAKTVLNQCSELGGASAVLALEYLETVNKKLAEQQTPEEKQPQE